ncbi:hypothetical protein LJC59_06435 [Desulfovibrio sp. OttesenSCG-928-A18]|nr:hypothetical protein [Desulfovibrio sp. OttesenSCG-928-A18]
MLVQNDDNPDLCRLSLKNGQIECPRARDRALLYTRGLDIDPMSSVELALESLKRAGERWENRQNDTLASLPGGAAPAAEAGPSPAALVMEELHALLRERQIALRFTTSDGQLLRSTPPMNRKRMIAEDMDYSPLRRAVKSMHRVFGRERKF